MTSQFNSHIFPGGTIGELGYADDLHLSEVNTPLRFHLNLRKHSCSDRAESSRVTLTVCFILHTDKHHPQKHHSDNFRDQKTPRWNESCHFYVFTARKNTKQRAKMTINHYESIFLHFLFRQNIQYISKPWTKPTSSEMNHNIIKLIWSGKKNAMCCFSLSQLIKSKLWLTWMWFVAWHCLKDLYGWCISVWITSASLSGVYLNVVTFNMLSYIVSLAFGLSITLSHSGDIWQAKTQGSYHYIPAASQRNMLFDVPHTLLP